MFYIKFVVTFMIYSRRKFHLPGSYRSLDFFTETKAKLSISRGRHIALYSMMKDSQISNISQHREFQDRTLVSWCWHWCHSHLRSSHDSHVDITDCRKSRVQSTVVSDHVIAVLYFMKICQFVQKLLRETGTRANIKIY